MFYTYHMALKFRHVCVGLGTLFYGLRGLALLIREMNAAGVWPF